MAEVTAPHKTPEWAIRKRRTQAPAIVLKWNDLKAVVVCPFPTCQSLHVHGFNRAPEGYPNSRLSHCDTLQQEYQLVWPFEADSIAEELDLGFELDREAGIWRTIGTDIEDPETEEVLEESAQGPIHGHPSEEHLLEPLNRLALDEEAYTWFISHCVTSDIEQAALCLESTDSAETLLHRKDSDGNTALALACMEGHYDMVRFLVEQGSLIDSKNKSGETPLIISLRYGRTEVATYLASYGASISSCDGSGDSVLSHAKVLLERLEDTRIYCHTPSFPNSSLLAKSEVIKDTDGSIVLEYREDPNPSVGMRYWEHQEKIDRVQIIINACIVHEATQKRIRKHKQNRARKVNASKVSISRSVVQTMVTVFRDAYQIPMADKRKTFGYLERGEAYNLVFAVSGWSGGEFADIDGCVDRELWTKRVFEFSRMVGHSLKRHEYDHLGREGSFYACHAEKQLMAFILWHYTSLQEKPARQAPEAEYARYERMSGLHQCIRNSTNSMVKCAEDCRAYRGPPVEVIRPVIRVTNAVCGDCANFRMRILECTGIDITLEMIG
ncbi:hypothetical protein IG631_23704 [Alternaria alternata]|jgi:hypothetical protein|nr:hypothetical protein IG631_23704 [Alternaria alternata]